MSPAGWAQWLDAVRDAADDLERCLASGRPLMTPPPVPSPPAGTVVLSPEQLGRATGLLGRLERLQQEVQAQLDAVAARLLALPNPRPRTAPFGGHELGATLDVAG